MDATLHVNIEMLFKIITATFAVATLVVWLIIRSLFRSHFRAYRKWIEEEVYTDWRGQMRALQEHYDELLEELGEHYDGVLSEYDTERITLAKSVKLLGERLAVQEEIFDRVIEGVMFANSISAAAKRARDRVRRTWERGKKIRNEWKHGKE